MKSLLFLSTILALWLSLADADPAIFPGQCPDHPPALLRNFRLFDFFGVWYEIERYESQYDNHADCTTAAYSLNPNNSVLVLNENLLLDGTRTYGSITGRAALSFPDDEPLMGQFNLTFPGFPSENKANFHILDSDYHSYAAIWNCENLSTSQYQESFWVLSRNPILDPRPGRVEELINNNFNRTLIRKTVQGPACVDPIIPFN